MKRNRAMLTARHPKVVLEIKDVEDAEGITTRKLSLNSEALPGRGEDDVLLLLAQQVLDATKIGNSTAKDAETRYNATIAALHEIAPVGPIEGMLSVQLISTHMAAMDYYKHLNKTNDRNTHAYHLNQVNKLSRTYVAYWKRSIGTVERVSRRSPSSTSMCIMEAKPSLVTSNTRGRECTKRMSQPHASLARGCKAVRG